MSEKLVEFPTSFYNEVIKVGKLNK